MDLAHLHLALNHVPVIGVIFGFVILLAGVLARSRAISGVGSAMLVVSALVAVPVYLTGESAEETVEKIGVSGSVIERHQSAAGLSLTLVIAAGIAALGALLFSRARPSKVRGIFVVAALLISLVAGTSMLRTANLGGQVRHTEIRNGTQAAPNADTGTAEKRDGRSEKDDDD